MYFFNTKIPATTYPVKGFLQTTHRLKKNRVLMMGWIRAKKMILLIRLG
jgi:hypothetical protein